MNATAPAITVEDDPVPIVLVLAATLRRSARDPKTAAAMAKASGAIALRSTADPQAATIRFGGGRVHVQRGVAADAGIVISTDVNAMSEPNAPKPKVEGIARHPKLALLASKVLEPPHGTWADEAQQFWAFAAGYPGVPRGMRIVCTDPPGTDGNGGGELVLGDPSAAYELHGSAHALLNIFTGNTVLGEDLFAGKVCAVGPFSETAVLTGRSIAWMLGG